MLPLGAVFFVGGGTGAADGATRAVATRLYSGDGLSFRYPTSWTPYHYSWFSTMSQPITYLSNTRLHNPCDKTQTGQTCGEPIDTLPRDGVLVQWTLDTWPGRSFQSFRGQQLRLDGHAARLQLVTHVAPDDTALGSVRGADLMVVLHVNDRAVSPSSSRETSAYMMTAWLRGPNVTQERREVMAMIQSVKELNPAL